MKEKFRKILQFLLNPRLVLCVAIAWMITNGWSYVMFTLGTLWDINWMTVVAGAYMAFLWIPFTPEKIITAAIAIIGSAIIGISFFVDKDANKTTTDTQLRTEAAVTNDSNESDTTTSTAPTTTTTSTTTTSKVAESTASTTTVVTSTSVTNRVDYTPSSTINGEADVVTGESSKVNNQTLKTEAENTKVYVDATVTPIILPTATSDGVVFEDVPKTETTTSSDEAVSDVTNPAFEDDGDTSEEEVGVKLNDAESIPDRLK